MDTGEAQEQFQRAGELFRASEYGEALEILTQLDNHYPDSRRVLFPMALCLERLGRLSEAKAICSRLVTEFGYTKAANLEARILLERDGQLQPAPGAPGADMVVEVDSMGLPIAPPPPQMPGAETATATATVTVTNWRTPAIIATVVVALALLAVPLLIGLVKGGEQPLEAPQTRTIERVVYSLGTRVLVAALLIVLGSVLVPLYATLLLLGKLPETATGRIAVAAHAFFCWLISCILPFFGLFVARAHLRGKYDMEGMDFLLLAGLSAGVLVGGGYAVVQVVFPQSYLESLAKNVVDEDGNPIRLGPAEVPSAFIIVDGDASEWASIPDAYESPLDDDPVRCLKVAKYDANLYAMVELAPGYRTAMIEEYQHSGDAREMGLCGTWLMAEDKPGHSFTITFWKGYEVTMHGYGTPTVYPLARCNVFDRDIEEAEKRLEERAEQLGQDMQNEMPGNFFRGTPPDPGMLSNAMNMFAEALNDKGETVVSLDSLQNQNTMRFAEDCIEVRIPLAAMGLTATSKVMFN